MLNNAPSASTRKRKRDERTTNSDSKKQKKSHGSPMEKLSPELILNILKFLDVRSLLNLARTSKKFKEIILPATTKRTTNEPFWNDAIERSFTKQNFLQYKDAIAKYAPHLDELKVYKEAIAAKAIAAQFCDQLPEKILNFFNGRDAFIEKIVKDNIPMLDLKGRMGHLRKVDFLKPEDINSKLSIGFDRYKRPFIVICLTSKNERNVPGYEEVPSYEKHVITMFQEFRDSEDWVLGGDHCHPIIRWIFEENLNSFRATNNDNLKTLINKGTLNYGYNNNWFDPEAITPIELTLADPKEPNAAPEADEDAASSSASSSSSRRMTAPR